MPWSYAVSWALLVALALCALRVGQLLVVRSPAAAPGGETSSRRCESCQLRWRAGEQDRRRKLALRAMRLRRHLRRRLTGRTTAADVASWDRCPRCLSRRVRASRGA